MLIVPALQAQTMLSEAPRRADVSPAWPGCDPNMPECTKSRLADFFAANIQLPAEAKEKGAGGVVAMEFVVEKSGLIGEIGAMHDPLFGPLVGFGLGGTDVEIEQDVHFRPTPLTDRDAADLIRESRAQLRLAGYRGHPTADTEAVTEVLLRMSQMAEEIPELREVDLNPVIVLPKGRGCVIVDARMKVGKR